MMIGLISGAMGPFSNAPVDTIKTRTYRIIYLNLRTFLHTHLSSRTAEGHCRTWDDSGPAHNDDREGYVEDGRVPIIL
jgi:hypothetical protein